MSRRSAALRMLVPAPLPTGDAVKLPLAALDTVWIQLTGTLCNIACRHCFITCGPSEDRVPMMSRDEVSRVLEDARALGVRELYLTGGEPMMHPEFFAVLEDALAVAPTSFLTNGLFLDEHAGARLAAIFAAARYSLDVRVSLDGMSAAINDPVRGRGTFDRITRGLRQLAAVGLAPVVTVVEHTTGLAASDERARFLEFLRALGLARPRVKFLPLLRIGREPRRTHGYTPGDLVRADDVTPEIAAALQCATCRLVTAHGVWTCPLLLDEPEARMGERLGDALGEVPLRWAACSTCVVEGLSCRT